MELFKRKLIGFEQHKSFQWRNIFVKSLGDAALLTKGVSETVENEAKEQKGGFLGMLVAAMGAS